MLIFYSLVARSKQYDRAKAGRFLDFPGQNTREKLVIVNPL
jgi:hypothetical protein